MGQNTLDKVRLDKWLWAARFFKTRPLAAEAINGGKAHLNGARVKASRMIMVGDTLEIRKGPYLFSIQVDQLIEKRVSATLAAEAYTESTESQAKRAQLSEQLRLQPQIDAGKQRPDKKARRQQRELHRAVFK